MECVKQNINQLPEQSETGEKREWLANLHSKVGIILDVLMKYCFFCDWPNIGSNFKSALPNIHSYLGFAICCLQLSSSYAIHYIQLSGLNKNNFANEGES